MLPTRFFVALLIAGLMTACGTPEERAEEYLSKAQAFYEAGDFEAASIEAKNAGQLDPKSAGARLILAKIALSEQDFRAAHGHLQIAAESAPDLLEVRLLLGFIYYYGKAKDELQVQVENAVRLAPEDPRVMLLEARLMDADGNKPAALVRAAESVRLAPNDPDALLFLASLTADVEGPKAAVDVIDEYVSRGLTIDKTQGILELRLSLLAPAGREEEIEAQLRELAMKFPDTDRYADLLTRYYVNTGRTEDAEEALSEIVRLNSDDLNRQLTLVKFLASQKGPDVAEAKLREFMSQSQDSPELQLALGQLYEGEESFDDAMREYERAIKLAPNSDSSFEARNRMVAIHIKKDRPDDAKQLLAEILSARPDNVDGLLARAALSFADGRYDDVVADARLAVRKDESSERGLMTLARAYDAQGNGVLAEDTYRRLLTLNPTNAEAATELANLLLGSGDLEAANEVLGKLQENEELSAELLETEVRLLIAKREFEAAEAITERIREVESDTGRADFLMGLIGEARGELSSAIEAYQRASDKSPNSVSVLQALVSGELKADRAKDAVATVKAFLGNNPDQPIARRLLAQAYTANGETKAAERELKELIDDQPTMPEAYLNLAALYELGSEERYAVLKQGLEANPKDQRLGALLGYEYASSGHLAEAQTAYELALSLNPDNDTVANNLAMLLLKKPDDAESHVRALQIARRFSGSESGVALDTLGWAYFLNNDITAAVRTLESAAEAAGDVAEIRYHLGMAYNAMGNKSRAREQLRLAVADNGEDYSGIEEARAALLELEGQ